MKEVQRSKHEVHHHKGQRMSSTESDYSIADGDVAHVADRYDNIFVGTIRNKKTFAISDGLALYGG